MDSSLIKNLSSVDRKKDIKKIADQICDGIMCSVFNMDDMTKGLFSDGRVIYLNATEKLRMGDFVKEGDSVATVLASGDFALDSIYHGAKNVLTFDINKYQYYFANLKFSSIQNMEYNEYCSFFSDIGDNKFLSLDIYESMKKRIIFDNYISEFMDVFINRFNDALKSVRRIIKKDVFYDEIMKNLNINEMSDMDLNYIFAEFGNLYCSPAVLSILHGLIINNFENSFIEDEDSYRKTREMILNSRIGFIDSDISNLGDNIKYLNFDSEFRKFDTIYLSNIPEYMSGEFFFDLIDSKLINLLERDGKIVYCCLGVDINRILTSNRCDAQYVFNYSDVNPMRKIKLSNDVCAYNFLKEKYDIELSESDSLCNDNGFDNKDTFVLVKKK